MTFFTINDLEKTEMAAGLDRRAVYLEKLMLTFVDFEPGVDLPMHSHPHEQISYVIEGAFEFRLGDEVRVLRAGEGVCCPPNVPHSATVLDEPTVALDAWYPQREEYR